jgi:NADH dehydrogenase
VRVTTNVSLNALNRVVIVGCWFGGLFAARALQRGDAHVTVIDRTNHHLFQPLPYPTATVILSEGDTAPAIHDILHHQRNATVLRGQVQDIDLQRRRLTVDTLGQDSELPYRATFRSKRRES